MMTSPYMGDNDRRDMLRLVRENPRGQVHVVDLPYRLSSWAFDVPDTVGLWRDVYGELIAWAVLQTPFWTLDYALANFAPPGTLDEILGWADAQAMTLMDSPYGRDCWFAAVPAERGESRRTFENHGYVDQSTVEDPWSQVTLELGTGLEFPTSPVKRGFILRPLDGEAEVEAYVGLHRNVFGTPNMTTGWRRKVLQHPDYLPDLDLVIESLSGELVAFCIGWIAELPGIYGDGPSIFGQIEPIGVREDYRRYGLAWAILAEVIRRLRDLGAGTILVQTDNFRDRAFHFYNAAGFNVVNRIAIYRKDIRTV